jgi:uncharacterized membrane protein
MSLNLKNEKVRCPKCNDVIDIFYGNTCQKCGDLSAGKAATTTKQSAGIGRLWYFFLMIAAGFFSNAYIENNQQYPLKLLPALVGTIGFVFFLKYLRLRNIGFEKRWHLALLTLLPIIGLLIVPVQEGYFETKKLDQPGKVTATIILGLLLIPVLILFLSKL